MMVHCYAHGAAKDQPPASGPSSVRSAPGAPWLSSAGHALYEYTVVEGAGEQAAELCAQKLRRSTRAWTWRVELTVLASRMLFFCLCGSPTTDGRSDGADASLEAAATADLGW